MSRPPITYTIRGASEYTGLGRSTIYNRIGDGSLAAIKAGGRTLITAKSLHAYLDSRPPADITTGRQTASTGSV